MTTAIAALQFASTLSVGIRSRGGVCAFAMTGKPIKAAPRRARDLLKFTTNLPRCKFLQGNYGDHVLAAELMQINSRRVCAWQYDLASGEPVNASG